MLKVANLHVRFGRRAVLRGVDLTVRQGEIVTLVGSNGAGKTTLLKTISGLERPSEGAISFDGERIDRMPSHAIIARRLVQIPEGRLLFPEMTVLEHLELGALRSKERGGDADPVDKVFALFPILAERRHQKAGTLSGGQQQMVAIGRGLMAAPRCLMLDEPSLGLAPIMVDALADTIVALHKSGLTILLVEQRVDLALRLADRGYVMETGRIVLDGGAKTLLADERVRQAYLGA
ncbi:MAG: ABC transporter ATP-binding protein [Xanthobacteraceae bacterium]|nr:ABC transporter ATP-binding protein [Myxococcota bacterium]MCZ7657953.1 ABC transporter ATP-binding protein [Xanthobacteraceae bacterium]